VTEWESVGAYRRALGGFEVKVRATPLLALSVDAPSAFETLASAPPGGPVTVEASDRAAEPWR
jgi:heme oxygenase (mycobilin-producing)